MIFAGCTSLDRNFLDSKKIQKAVKDLSKTAVNTISNQQIFLCYSIDRGYEQAYERNYGIVLGRVFNKNRDEPVDPPISQKNFLDEVWGKYVYFQYEEDGLQIYVDPVGQMPCFYHKISETTVYFASSIELLIRSLQSFPGYDWAYFYTYLINGWGIFSKTPFQNIFEIPPGCVLKIGAKGLEVSPFWNLFKFYQKQEYRDPAEALSSTIKSWIEPYEQIYVSLSGGLDSSSIMHCLKSVLKDNQKITALNFYHKKISLSNESQYARKVCDEINAKMIAIETSSALPFDPYSIQAITLPNKPSYGLTYLKTLELIRSYIPEGRSVLQIGGLGGDHLFLNPPPKLAIADWIFEKGFLGSFAKLQELAHIYRDPYYSIIWETFRGLFSHYLTGKTEINLIQKLSPSWLKKQVKTDSYQKIKHPLLERQMKTIPPGKKSQIYAYFEGISSIHIGSDIIPSSFYPFLYEPVVRSALSYPSYDLFSHGYDRYPFRESIFKRFQTDQAWRRTKGDTTGVFQLGVKKNLNFVLALCLDGEIAKQGLFNQEALHQAILQTSVGENDESSWAFTHLASLEIFIDLWNQNLLTHSN